MINRDWQNNEEDKEIEETSESEPSWSLQFAYTENLRNDAKRIAECVIKTRIIKGRFPPMEVDVEACPRPTEYMRQLVAESITPEQQEEIRQYYQM